jgi:enoyl-CoA hydratase/carnithine racemase
MDEYKGKTLSWRLSDGVVELVLDRPPANEIGLAMLGDLERFVSALPALESKASALILYSGQKAGFSAGADLRELFEQAQKMAGHLSAYDHRSCSRRMFWRRVRAGAGVRFDRGG